MISVGICLSIVLLAWTITTAETEECSRALLRPPVLQVIKPLVEVRTKEVMEEFDDAGRWRGESQYTPEVERRFAALLRDRSRVGDEALAYLLNVYLGEHFSEELVCEVVGRGKRILPLVRSFHTCLPLTGLEPLHKFVRGSGVLAPDAADGIVRGDKCVHE